ncbi:hypothetical protein HanLR1_Chr05g0172841 [Helianthus annuus]|nr:hypothetical protein HanLR1_Chr05g0172841 [Helianthus annuus]
MIIQQLKMIASFLEHPFSGRKRQREEIVTVAQIIHPGTLSQILARSVRQVITSRVLSIPRISMNILKLWTMNHTRSSTTTTAWGAFGIHSLTRGGLARFHLGVNTLTSTIPTSTTCATTGTITTCNIATTFTRILSSHFIFLLLLARIITGRGQINRPRWRRSRRSDL